MRIDQHFQVDIVRPHVCCAFANTLLSSVLFVLQRLKILQTQFFIRTGSLSTPNLNKIYCLAMRMSLRTYVLSSSMLFPPTDGVRTRIAMNVADTAAVPVVEVKGVEILDVDDESTPKLKRCSSPVPPPPAPCARRGHGFATVFQDVVEVYTAGGECMGFDTKDITTGDLRYAVALKRGVPMSQVQLFCGQSELSDEIPVMIGQLSVAFRSAPGQELFPKIVC